jgi:hypothetical protein
VEEVRAVWTPSPASERDQPAPPTASSASASAALRKPSIWMSHGDLLRTVVEFDDAIRAKSASTEPATAAGGAVRSRAHRGALPSPQLMHVHPHSSRMPSRV